MFDQYRVKKKKKEVDPNAPPRPTLLGHEKEMKSYRSQFELHANIIKNQEIAIRTLERKVSNLQSKLDAMSSLLSRNK